MWFGQADPLPSDSASHDRFGFWVAIGGNVAVVGANGDDNDCPGLARQGNQDRERHRAKGR